MDPKGGKVVRAKRLQNKRLTKSQIGRRNSRDGGRREQLMTENHGIPFADDFTRKGPI